MQKRIYLDHNATTPVHPEVMAVILEALERCPGNPSSVHMEGQRARLALEKARADVAALLDAKRDEIYFTSGGTESNNLALFSHLEKSRADGSTLPEVVTTPIEHPSILNPLRHLEKQNRLRLKFISLNHDGSLDLKNLETLLNENTALVTVMLVNNELGTLHPVKEIADLCRERAKPIPVHCDAIQAVGRIVVDPGELGITSLALSAHKFYGPKGVGALWVGTPKSHKGSGACVLDWLQPRVFGGGQEAGMRSGTENLPGILGMGKASQIAKASLASWEKTLRPLRDLLETKVRQNLDGVSINAESCERIYSTSNLRFTGVPGDILQQALDLSGIAVATGSACSSGTTTGSSVLKALGRDPMEAREAIRISLGYQNSEADILQTVNALVTAVNRIRATFGNSKLKNGDSRCAS